jgi:hypothetical protein
MDHRIEQGRIFWIAFSAFFLIAMIWLVSPYFKLDSSDYLHAGRNALRLGLGLFISILFLGKWAFDLFMPQGLARKVSRFKTVALILANLTMVVFIIFIVARAAALFLQSGIDKDAANF